MVFCKNVILNEYEMVRESSGQNCRDSMHGDKKGADWNNMGEGRVKPWA